MMASGRLNRMVKGWTKERKVRTITRYTAAMEITIARAAWANPSVCCRLWKPGLTAMLSGTRASISAIAVEITPSESVVSTSPA